MQPQEVQALLESGLEACQVKVNGEGSHYDILVIGERSGRRCGSVGP